MQIGQSALCKATPKDRKACQGSLQINSTNESGVCALALPFSWVLLRSCRQREESSASALSFCFSVFCFFCIVLLKVNSHSAEKQNRKSAIAVLTKNATNCLLLSQKNSTIKL